jgi:hypothetical protein
MKDATVLNMVQVSQVSRINEAVIDSFNQIHALITMRMINSTSRDETAEAVILSVSGMRFKPLRLLAKDKQLGPPLRSYADAR